MKSRKQVSLGTYTKIKELFSKNPELTFAPTFIRDELNLDYLSVKLCLTTFLKEHFIVKEDNRYKRRQEIPKVKGQQGTMIYLVEKGSKVSEEKVA
jgi:hypothetical protein